MEKITQVTEADVGRIAVSEDGYFRVKILKADGNESTVEFLKDTSRSEKFDVSQGFGLINGRRTMYWEDTPSKPRTPFETWCAEKGYDPKGCFVYDMDLSDLDDLSFPDSGKFTIIDDDTTSCPRFVDENGFSHYEYFNSPFSGVVMKQEQTEKAKIAKPRFHKKRQKPPVRQKTDVVIQYMTGHTYTIKNVNSVSVGEKDTIITTLQKIEDGIFAERNFTIDSDLVAKLTVKSPGKEIEIHSYGDNEFLVYFENGYAIVRRWFKSF